MTARAMCASIPPTPTAIPVVRVFTSNTTYTPTAGARWCEVEMVGAGASTASNNGTATARLGQPGVVVIREYF